MNVVQIKETPRGQGKGGKASTRPELEQERLKLYVLAANLGMSHPAVLKQSRYLDQLILFAMREKNHHIILY